MGDRDDFGLPVRKISNISSRKGPPPRPVPNPFDIEASVPPSEVARTPIKHEPPTDTSDSLESAEEDADVEIESNEAEPENLQYRPSAERELSRNSFKAKLLRAERKMLKQGFGEEVVAVDATDDNAVVRFLLSNKGT
jgi:hypothetical protein